MISKAHPKLCAVRELSRFMCGDIVAVYTLEGESGNVGLSLLPVGGPRPVHARWIRSGSFEHERLPASMPAPPPWRVDNCIQMQSVGTPHGWGFSAGLTSLASRDCMDLRFRQQRRRWRKAGLKVETEFTHSGYPDSRFIHHLRWTAGQPAVEVWAEVRADGGWSLALDFLSAFCLAGISPYHLGAGEGALWLHRFVSWWAEEGRPQVQRLEDLGLEPSWAAGALRVERWGQNGSMPVRGHFPAALVEDRKAGVTWGVQLEAPGSWQIELARRDDKLILAGGLPSFDTGHWRKEVRPGTPFETPHAFLTVAHASPDEVCQRLTQAQVARVRLRKHPDARDLPVICNDWCTHWADTSHNQILAMADSLSGLPVRYFVIDDGWMAREGAGHQHIGDWDVDPKRFPHGLKSTCEELRKRGFVPGVWFEFEAVSEGTRAWEQTGRHLQRDGRPVQVGSRRFWDFRDPRVFDDLRQRIVGLLRDCGIGYLKVDYNDNIGIGVDGADSLAEGLREHLAGVQRFFRMLKDELPDLVIENCASGGHRIEPSFIALTDMSSFSDAHESREIPILALNAQRLNHPALSQIWAVLHETDRPARLDYSLAAGFLGRLCLSGSIAALSPKQLARVRQALDLYGAAVPVLRDGTTRFEEHHNACYRKPEGWQAMVRTAGDRCLVVVHTFARPPAEIRIALPPGRWRVEGGFGQACILARGSAGPELILHKPAAFHAAVALLRKPEQTPPQNRKRNLA